MDPYEYENMHDPRGFPIHPQAAPAYLLHHHPGAFAAESMRMRGGAGRRRPGGKLSTDPQSVAARERRHRISDRFRVLRSLVPGGSKMDTVSMLEQAIHYVKFLKAQVTLHQAALMQHEDGCSHEFGDAADAADATGHCADDEVSTMQQLPGRGVPVQEVMNCYLNDLGPHPHGQMSSAAAHDLPPLPSCVFDEESAAAACYSVCALQGEDARIHGSY